MSVFVCKIKIVKVRIPDQKYKNENKICKKKI